MTHVEPNLNTGSNTKAYKAEILVAADRKDASLLSAFIIHAIILAAPNTSTKIVITTMAFMPGS